MDNVILGKTLRLDKEKALEFRYQFADDAYILLSRNINRRGATFKRFILLFHTRNKITALPFCLAGLPT